MKNNFLNVLKSDALKMLVSLIISIMFTATVFQAERIYREHKAGSAPAASAPPAAEAKIETELLQAANRRLETENARLRGVIHDCLWLSRGVDYPNKPETLVQQHLDFQKLLAGALE
jgi:hypothetical protein